jgi:RsiW-degrading membrane proteinase PrsW (M82 family)
MISWWWLIVAYLAGGLFGLLAAGMARMSKGN